MTKRKAIRKHIDYLRTKESSRREFGFVCVALFLHGACERT